MKKKRKKEPIKKKKGLKIQEKYEKNKEEKGKLIEEKQETKTRLSKENK